MGLDGALRENPGGKREMKSPKAGFFHSKLSFDEHLVEFCWMVSPADFSYVSP